MPAHFKPDDESSAFEYRGRILYPMSNGKFYERKKTKFRSSGQRFYWKYASCCQCGEKTLLPICQISRREGKVTCSKECLKKIKSGPNHWLWKPKTEKVRANGKTALKIWMPEHPKAKKGRIYEHRFVMEQKLGRLLQDHEVVHHIDCDPHNNSPENLSVCSSGRDHLLAHGTLNNCVKMLLKDGFLCYDDASKTYYLPK